MRSITKLHLGLIVVVGLLGCKSQNPGSQPQVTNVAVEQPKSITIRGEEIHYIEKGSGEPLIFIHGTLGDYRAWIPRVERYSGDYNVIAYSRRYAYPNNQVFDHSADYSVRIHADDLYTFIKELGFDQVNLVGHSYGAYTALALALHHPEIVGSLVLGEPPAASLLENSPLEKTNFTEFQNKYLQSAGIAFSESDNEKGIETFLKGVMGDSFSLNQVPSEIKQGWMDNLSEVWGVSSNEWIEPLDVSKIEELDLPVLLLMGSQSPIWFGGIIKELHRLLPQSELVNIENSSHGLYFENPEATDEAIEQFLKRN